VEQQLLEEICARVDREVQEHRAVRFGDIVFDLHISPGAVESCKTFLNQYTELARAYQHDRHELENRREVEAAPQQTPDGLERSAQEPIHRRLLSINAGRIAMNAVWGSTLFTDMDLDPHLLLIGAIGGGCLTAYDEFTKSRWDLSTVYWGAVAGKISGKILSSFLIPDYSDFCAYLGGVTGGWWAFLKEQRKKQAPLPEHPAADELKKLDADFASARKHLIAQYVAP